MLQGFIIGCSRVVSLVTLVLSYQTQGIGPICRALGQKLRALVLEVLRLCANFRA